MYIPLAPGKILPFLIILAVYKENTACAEPVAKAEAAVALSLFLRKLYFLLVEQRPLHTSEGAFVDNLLK
ncbi:hypothetical protein [Sporomusa sp. GT1]|uniref:hypothetical protein n=1 Tax=Sporomusa sp. GT1 TaxID=1534747 RepID=UPI00166B2E1D|nr:hypothetical protein [Sporomusa sp. GT1]